ncbi:hypothetical protein C3L33_00906, partial [Rhododendron williamsianum]
MLGRRVFSDGDAKADEFKSMVVELMVLSGVFNIGDFVPSIARVARSIYKGILSEILEEHKVGGGAQNHTNLLRTLISVKEDADGEGGKLTDTYRDQSLALGN